MSSPRRQTRPPPLRSPRPSPSQYQRDAERHSSSPLRAGKRRRPLYPSTLQPSISPPPKRSRVRKPPATASPEPERRPDARLPSAPGVRRPPIMAEPWLSRDQKEVLKLVVDRGQSVFFTGAAGTGKTVLLQRIVRTLRTIHQKAVWRLAITAATGMAALMVGGGTLHSFAGVNLGHEPVDTLAKRLLRNPLTRLRWQRVQTLIIDEISMVDGEFFDKLEAIARHVRRNDRPFGGIQLVITGDFQQLPPVAKRGQEALFCFEAASWPRVVRHTICLRQVFRQKDAAFAAILNELRGGQLSPTTIETFQSLDRPLACGGDIVPTELFPTRGEVDSANAEFMHRLPGELVEFHARDSGGPADSSLRAQRLKACIAPATLELKKDAQVMLIKNIDDALVNGSVGTVVDFSTTAAFHAQQNTQGDVGDTGDATPPSSPLSPRVVGQENPTVHEPSTGESRPVRWPVVRFVHMDGSTRTLLCEPQSWKSEGPDGRVEASRTQVPLILAWALSIHKAQGQTLDWAKVDLGRAFAPGQAYTALSRVTTLAGLQVVGFHPSRVWANEKACQFYASLTSTQPLPRQAAALPLQGSDASRPICIDSSPANASAS